MGERIPFATLCTAEREAFLNFFAHENFFWKDEPRLVTPAFTRSNACFVTLALLYGVGSPHRTMTLAVMGGLDTDCNGATAGSIAGIRSGKAGWDSHLDRKLGGRIRTLLVGMPEITVDEVVERFCALAYPAA